MQQPAYIDGGPRDGSVHRMPAAGLRHGFRVRFGYDDGRPDEWYELSYRLKNGYCVAVYLGDHVSQWPHTSSGSAELHDF